jgi:hypothetical protein
VGSRAGRVDRYPEEAILIPFETLCCPCIHKGARVVILTTLLNPHSYLLSGSIEATSSVHCHACKRLAFSALFTSARTLARLSSLRSRVARLGRFWCLVIRPGRSCEIIVPLPRLRTGTLRRNKCLSRSRVTRNFLDILLAVKSNDP